jgi:C4-dicarboxylate transporter, DctM subunit
MGAGGAFLIGLARGRLSRPDIRRSLLQATRTAAAVFTVLIGALLFGYFLTVTQTPQKVTAFMTGLGVGRRTSNSRPSSTACCRSSSRISSVWSF